MANINPQDAVQKLILERFDHANNAAAKAEEPIPTTESSPPVTNGLKVEHLRHTQVKEESTPPSSRAISTPSASLSAAKSEPESDSEEISPPKKKRKQTKQVDDAKLAAMLQAQENSRARATRGGNKKVVKKTPKKPRKKSEKKVKADDDSELEVGSDGEVKEKVKRGGFHKLYHLSAPLADLVGEPTVRIITPSVSFAFFIFWIFLFHADFYSSHAPKPSRKYGSTSKLETCKTLPINAKSAATRRCSWYSSRIKCTCSP
jgi:upstream activation factor subunit UAF30